ncbi:MAG: hypothetical protein K2P84_03830 [Undibacterium sp.]|nr:hypothetical protein [Undibacterium sp.]
MRPKFPKLRLKTKNATPSYFTRNVVQTTSFDENELEKTWQEIFAQKQKSHRFLDVVLPDAWVRHFLVQTPVNANSLADIQAAACKRFETLYGEDADTWCIMLDVQNLIGDGVKNVVCAVPKNILAALEKNARRYRQHFLSIQSNFVKTWNTHRHLLLKNSWFLVPSADVLLLVIIDKGTWQFVRQVEIRPGSSTNDAWLQTCVSREALMLGVPQPVSLQLASLVPDTFPMAWKKHGVDRNGVISVPMNIAALSSQNTLLKAAV